MTRDLWYAIRQLRLRPWHTATVVGIIALGTGAALTVARIADAVLLRSLPYTGADRLVTIVDRMPFAPTLDLPLSDVGYRAQEQRNRTLEAVAGYRVVGVNLVARGTPERVTSARVTASFFDVFGIPVRLGRAFTPHEESARGAPVLILSSGYWRRSFGADRNVIGTTVRVDGRTATIIGVADARLSFPSASVDYWTLMDLDPVGTSPFERGINLVGRVRSGTPLTAAAAEATRVTREVARENPGPHSPAGSDVSGFYAIAHPLRDDIVGGVKPTLIMLTIAVVLVLGLTCVNVASLELVRSAARRTDLAVRIALGARRTPLVLAAVAQGGVQSAVGGLIGLAASVVTVRTLRALLPTAFAAADTASLSTGVIVATAITIALCAAAAAGFPIVAAFRENASHALRTRGSGRALSLMRRGLVAAQLAFACVLVDGAILMIASVRSAQRVALGFDPAGVSTFDIALPREVYASSSGVTATFGALTQKLRSTPGIAHVALASALPLAPEQSATLLAVEGRPFRADGSDPNVDLRVVSGDYFAALAIRILKGTGFTEGDTYPGGTPLVISETLAKLLWPDGSDPVGQRLRTGPYAPWMPIIGVAADVKNRSLTEPSRPELYLPFGAERSPVGVAREMTVVVRATNGNVDVFTAAQRAMADVGPELPIFAARRLSEVVLASQAREITTARTIAAFAAIALALAIAGSYAVLMFAVAQRQKELAVRQAMGATPTGIVHLVLREMTVLLGAGLGAGLAGSAALSLFISRFLFGVTTLDPAVTAITVLCVAVAGLGAASIPAWQAARIDPILALRSE